MSPSLATSLHAIGGVCSVSPTNPPPEGAGTTYTTAAQIANGLNATFNELVHYVATEPNETFLRVGVLDGEVEVAFESVVLGTLRPGFRCLQLRSPQGTRIRLCSLFVHIEIAEEANSLAQVRELRSMLAQQQSVISQQAETIAEQRETITRLTDQVSVGSV